jgi:hypothetical protein
MSFVSNFFHFQNYSQHLKNIKIIKKLFSALAKIFLNSKKITYKTHPSNLSMLQ